MQRLNFERVLKSFNKRTEGRLDVVANLRDFQELTPEIAKVIITLSTDTASKEKNFYAVANCFENMACAIPNSFRTVPTSRAFAAVGYVVKNGEVREATTASLQKMKVMAGNLLMDEEDSSLWELKNVEGSRYLTRKVDESLSELVQMAGVMKYNELTNVPPLRQLVSASMQEGEYVVYVHPTHQEVRAGYLLGLDEENRMEIISHTDNGSLDKVSTEFLIESTYIKHDEVAAEGMEMPSGNDKERMKEYYRKMFEYSPEYYQKMADIIDSNAVL